MQDFRIGFGYDVHQLKKGEDLNLGGIVIPHAKGTLGHSDADVLIHAICDALLGAINLRDIGFHFPDTDPEYNGIDSKKLLGNVVELIHNNGYRIGNIDTTICVEKPKINPHIEQMQEVLCPILQIERDRLSIKATTSEKMSFIGKQKGISVYAVTLVFRK